MGMLGKLGSLFVELKAQGVDVVQKAFGDLGGSMSKLATTAQTGGAGMAAAVKATAAVIPGLTSSVQALGAAWSGLGLNKNPFDVKELAWTAKGLAEAFGGINQAAQGLAKAFAPAISQLSGFVTAGVAASAEGQMISYQFEELSHQIASLFAPQIHAAIDALGRLVSWFQNLSGEQQASLRGWGLTLGGIAAAAFVLPRVIALFQGLAAAIAGVRVALAALTLANPWLLLIAGLAAAVAAFWAFSSASEKASGDVKDAAGEIKGGEASPAGEVKATPPPAPATSSATVPWGRNAGSLEEQRRAAERLSASGASLEEQRRAASEAYHAPLTPKPKAADREEIGRRVGGFESFDQTWKRIGRASLMASSGASGGKTPAEESRDYLKEIAETVRRLDGKEIKPTVAR